ncbi:CtsR family transcriptional regulator [Weissella tructae]|uniref:Transcriptional regulator CtsR n=2 Tax=Weissella TaxID=46255 RepID=A0A075U1L0_9LACO|nr:MULTISPECIES: CtsR family transcriptional regulator [Weissella]AIG66063.1 Transcriptional regulator CtsR [Weissella tructae]AIM63442.1 Transcriptional regulator CtsR [Weissella ceti]AIM64777.1 Transcriptional regulator CtsR [Weissella ceti]ELA07435.1 transcriptional repressor CtsR [Weissella ceti NC36]QVV91215.1 CtsR family transcriptional regulator [Weissella tructae]
MTNNMSDQIEAYLKALLAESDQIELNRSALAERFDVVPSQINYVMRSRFSLENGYVVVSKRGGRGFVRIERVHLRREAEQLDALIDQIGPVVTIQQSEAILACLVRDQLLTEHEAELMRTMFDKDALAVTGFTAENRLRARLLHRLLHRLKFESERD